MKRISAIALLLLPIAIFAQCGIYKTLQDFKDNKLSQTCESIMVEKLGSKFILILNNADKKEKIELKGSGIWGYKKEMTDYRIIDDVPHAIATKGEIWVYSGAGDKIGLAPPKSDFPKDTTYYKESNALPFASKGLDGALVEVGNPMVLYKMMKPKTAEEVKGVQKKFLITFFLEDLADYYNSLRSGYLSNRFKQFYYGGVRRTADGKRPVSF